MSTLHVAASVGTCQKPVLLQEPTPECLVDVHAEFASTHCKSNNNHKDRECGPSPLEASHRSLTTLT